MKTQSSGEHSVAEAYLNGCFLGCARCGCKARHLLAPVFKILPCISDNSGVAGGSRGGVQADKLLFRHGEKAERVVVPKILLCGIGDILNIRKLLYPLCGNVVFFKSVMIELYVFVAIINECPESFKLKFFKFGAFHAFRFSVPDSVFHF